MDSPASSEFVRFLDLAGHPAAPVEWTPGWVEVLVAPEEWESACLVRDSEPLPLQLRRIGGAVRVLAEWPRSGTGNYELRLIHDSTSARLHVQVLPEKISEASYRALVDDLEAALPASIALSLQRLGGLSGVELLPPGENTLAEELLRLERAVYGVRGRPGLAPTLRTLAADPHRVLRGQELWVRTHQARRPHPARLPLALATPGNLAPNRRPARVVDSRVEHTADVYENRLVKSYLGQVERRLARVRRLARDTFTVARLESLRGALAAARRGASFLDDVRDLTHAPDRVSMVLLKRPDYRAALEGFLEFQRRLAVRLDAQALDAPLENLPYLYQVWGTLRVIAALLLVGDRCGYRVRRDRITGRELGGVFLRFLPDGFPAVELLHPLTGTRVRLIPERTYGAVGPLHSITYSQRPDVAVEVLPALQPARVYLFDPKYKLEGDPLEADGEGGKPKKVDLDKMHAYRDAIRDAEGERVVRYAAVLYPGPERRYRHGIEALSSYPGAAAGLDARLMEVLTEAVTAP